MMNNSSRNGFKKLLTLGIVIVIAIGFAGFIIYRIDSGKKEGKSRVTIMAVPEDASITFNGKKQRDGITYLEPGTYKIEVKKEGFASLSRTVKIEKKEELITLTLAAESIQAQEWARKNRNLYLEAEGAAGTKAQEEGEAFSQSNPITRILPYNALYYRIDYGVSKLHKGGVVVQINANNPVARERAIDYLRGAGFEPSDLEIEFVGYINPLGGTSD